MYKLLNGLKSKLPQLIHENANLKNCLPNTLSISIEGVEAHSLTSKLSRLLYISTGSACHADSIQISPVLKAMQVDHKIATGTLRISTGKHTSIQEIERAIEIISEEVGKLKE